MRCNEAAPVRSTSAALLARSLLTEKISPALAGSSLRESRSSLLLHPTAATTTRSNNLSCGQTWASTKHVKYTQVGVAHCMGRKPTNKSYAQFGWPPGDPTHPSNPRMPNGRHDQFEWGETEPKSARRQPTQRHGRQSNMWHRNVATSRNTTLQT